jgi:2-polyprenyl-6-hydroxyphenyl methylase/3-demethylubiquinone-9 3-methyltransferase
MTTNKSDVELDFFANQADAWWSNKGAAALLHQINPVRLRFITEAVTLKNLKVLDIGCGGGILTEAMARQGAVTTGLDLAEPLIDVAQQHAQSQNLNISYVCEAVEDYAEKNQGAFDVITCMEMLEHVPDPSSIIKAISAMLKPGGMVFLSTIDRSAKSFLKVIVGAEYIMRMLPRGTHHYDQFIKPSELTHALREHGINPMKLGGFTYNPLFKTFKLVAKPVENYLLSGQKV